MLNLKTIEKLRTKQEVLNYFKQQGTNITEEEIENLKQNYDQTQKSNNALTMQQLDKVAGGGPGIIRFGSSLLTCLEPSEFYSVESKNGKILFSHLNIEGINVTINKINVISKDSKLTLDSSSPKAKETILEYIDKNDFNFEIIVDEKNTTLTFRNVDLLGDQEFNRVNNTIWAIVNSLPLETFSDSKIIQPFIDYLYSLIFCTKK